MSIESIQIEQADVITPDRHKALCLQWLEEYKALIAKIVRVYAWSKEDGQDLYQEIALQLWRSVNSYKGEAKESTWIYRVALNTAMAWSRRHRKQTREIEEAPSGDLNTPARIAETGERLDWLYAEIHKLPPIQRSLVLLYLEGLSYKEIAGILGISESNVGVKLNRTKNYLSELAKGRDNEP